MLLTIALPCTFCKPASKTSHLDESIITGTAATIESPAISRKYLVIASTPSSSASSILMSMIVAPFWTCCRATSTASSNLSLRIRFAKALEPVTLVRSPTIVNRVSGLNVVAC